MRAAICMRYGSPEVIAVTRMAKPEPKPDEVLIRVRASTLSSADCRIRALNMPRGFALLARLALGLRRPRRAIFGTELAGEIEAVGASVTRFHVGERVFAFPGAALGGHADYRCMPENGRVASIPHGLGFNEAAALCFGGTAALDFLRRGGAKAGEKLLVRGASGAVGSAAIQLARHMGLDVVALCSTRNIEWVAKLGASRVIDYCKTNVFDLDDTYDIVLDTVGGIPFSRWTPLLRTRGRLLALAADLPEMLMQPWISLTRDVSLITGTADEHVEDMEYLAELAAIGVYRPMIDCVYPLDAIQKAHTYVDSGHKRGNVVIDFQAA